MSLQLLNPNEFESLPDIIGNTRTLEQQEKLEVTARDHLGGETPTAGFYDWLDFVLDSLTEDGQVACPNYDLTLLQDDDKPVGLVAIRPFELGQGRPGFPLYEVVTSFRLPETSLPGRPVQQQTALEVGRLAVVVN